jgi:ABC-type transport system substrate-binding protein
MAIDRAEIVKTAMHGYARPADATGLPDTDQKWKDPRNPKKLLTLEVLAEYAGKPVLVQKNNLLAATFHPELTADSAVHEHFLQMVAGNAVKPVSV